MPKVTAEELAELSLVDKALARAQKARRLYQNKVSSVMWTLLKCIHYY